MSMKTLCLLFLALLCVSSTVAAPEDHAASFKYAMQLYEQQEYPFATAEFKRIIFLSADAKHVEESTFLLGVCQEMSESWLSAIQAYKQYIKQYPKGVYAENAAYRVIESMFGGAYYTSVQSETLQLLAKYPQSCYRDDAVFLAALSHYMVRDWVKARLAFQEFAAAYPESPLRAAAERLSQACQAVQDRPLKSRRLSGALSTVIPGAGQLYCSRRGDAIMTFLTSVTAAYLIRNRFGHHDTTGGILLSAIGASIYLGNIYGAVGAAEGINRQNEQTLSDNAFAEIQQVLLTQLGHPESLSMRE